MLWKLLSKGKKKNPQNHELFYVSHPSIYHFSNALIKLQTATYMKVRNIDSVLTECNTVKDKEQYLLSVHEKFMNKKISREQYVQNLGFKFQAKSM